MDLKRVGGLGMLIAVAALAAPPAALAAGWQRVEAANPPPARFDHTVSLDPASQKLVLFGGRDGTQTFGDTWVYDLASQAWREVKSVPAPEPRFGHAAAYDPAVRRVLLFAGQGAGFFNDVWAFDSVAETWRKLDASSAAPVKRYGTAAVVDTKRNQLVITHGFASGRFDDTWAFDLATNTWAQIRPAGGPPLKRCLHEAVYDTLTDRLILFGGCSSPSGPCPQGDLWALDLESRQWRELTPSGPRPSARQNPALIGDGAGRVYLFGGDTDTGPSADVWVLEVAANRWTSLAAPAQAPAARFSHDAVWNPGAGQMIQIGGAGNEGALNDLWIFTP